MQLGQLDRILYDEHITESADVAQSKLNGRGLSLPRPYRYLNWYAYPNCLMNYKRQSARYIRFKNHS